MEKEELLGARQVAEILQISVATLHSWTKKNIGPHPVNPRPHKRKYWRKAEVAAFLRNPYGAFMHPYRISGKKFRSNLPYS